ncbi:glycosyltransferase family 2 protein [Halobium palmae]|uniref:Glycosyltransferase family 2 protein n=1 Tax=Halobium palmae TaxID=1776492 RepID=A0ABD5RXD2_9EURY
MNHNGRENSPLVSVVVPTYDRPEKLAEAVESVLEQTYGNLELIVVDDASPTPARTVLEGMDLGTLRWSCIRHDTNRGANAARNSGIRESSGEFVAFLDDDDDWDPEAVEGHVALFRNGGAAVGVTILAQRYVRDGEVTTVKVPGVEGDATPKLLEGKTAGTFSAIAVRRSLVDTVGLPDERLPSWQDRDWLIRLSRHCRFAVDPRPRVTRRQGDYEQIGDGYEAKRDVSYPLLLEKYRELAAEYGLEREFVATMTRGLAGVALRRNSTREARGFAWQSVRLNPWDISAWLYLVLSLLDPRVYRSFVGLRRRAVRCLDRI